MLHSAEVNQYFLWVLLGEIHIASDDVKDAESRWKLPVESL